MAAIADPLVDWRGTRGHCCPLGGFLGLTLLLFGAPALAVLFMGKRAERVLAKIRDWMNESSWIVNELVLLLFVGIVISSIAG